MAPGAAWAGLWDFPRFPVEPAAALGPALVDNVRRLTGVTVEPGRHLKTLRHGVTRFRITLECYEAEYRADSNAVAELATRRWVRPAELERYPLSTTGRKLARLA